MRARVSWLVLALLAHSACGKPGPAHGAKPSPAASDHPQAGPTPSGTVQLPAPIATFVAPKAWRSKKPDAVPIEPPDLAQLTWYVFVEQYEPLQTKTPEWQPLAADKVVEVAMPAGSAFRCVALPLKIEPDPDTFSTKLLAWALARSVLCSSDGWHTWIEHSHRARLLPDGTRKVAYRSEAMLRERASDGTIRQTVLALRSEVPRRDATTGPPKILPGVTVDPD